MVDKLLRFKICFYDNNCKKHFKIIESNTEYNAIKQIRDKYNIPNISIDEEIKVQPGFKYVRICR